MAKKRKETIDSTLTHSAETGESVKRQANRLKSGDTSGQDTAMSSVDIRKELYVQGFVKFSSEVPWAWELIQFVEKMYVLHHEEVERRLDALRDKWDVYSSSGSRPGSAAAEIVTQAMESVGVAVYTPPGSHSEDAPFSCTAPRFYVSLTAAAWRHWPNGAPGPPEELAQVLWPHEFDWASPSSKWPNKIRGLGWALAPPRSDPQSLHADIWGEAGKPRPGRVRFHHILWKVANQGKICNTQIVPGGFTDGQSWEAHYEQLTSASATCLLVDNEVLHRGAPNGADAWARSCSIELCTRTGYEEVWKGGSEDDGVYEMLPICWSRSENDQE